MVSMIDETEYTRRISRRQYLAKLVLGHAISIEHLTKTIVVRLEDLKFEEPFEVFPSEKLVTQVALAVETYRPGNYQLADLSPDLADYVCNGGMGYSSEKLVTPVPTL